MAKRICLGALAPLLLLAACGGGGDSDGDARPATDPPRYKVSGSVQGLRGTGLTLSLDQGNNVVVQSDGTFTFPTTLVDRAAYNISIVTQPAGPAQFCVLTNASGAISGADIANVVVTCPKPPPLQVIVSVSGLTGIGLQVALQAYAGSTPLEKQVLVVLTDGDYFYMNSLEEGMSYEVTIANSPQLPTQVCTIENGVGTVRATGLNKARVVCALMRRSVSGIVSGLRGSGLVLTNKGGDELAISSNGVFTFPTQITDGSSFDVRVAQSPTNLKQSCSVMNGTGSAFADITSVRVACSATQQLGSAGDDEALAADTDTAGALYVAGRTTGQLDGAANGGGWDGFLFRMTADGEIAWRRQLRTSGDETVEAVKVDGNGNVYIAGSTTGTLGNLHAGSDDGFVAKFTRDGALLWMRQIGTAASDKAHALSLEADGSLYVVGETSGALGGTPNAGAPDLFVARLDSSGTTTWLQQLGTSTVDVAYAVSTDGAGAVYVAGSTLGNLDGVSNTSGGEAGFVVKYSSAGAKQSTWLLCQGTDCRTFLPSGIRMQSRIRSIAAGVLNGVIVSGWMRDDRTGDFGARYAMNAGINSSGLRTWSSSIGDGTSDALEHTSLVLGKADGTLFSTTVITSAFTGLPQSSVSRQGLSTLNQLYHDSLYYDDAHATAMAVAPNLLGEAYVVGYVTGSITNQPSLGGRDIFIMRYSNVGVRL